MSCRTTLPCFLLSVFGAGCEPLGSAHGLDPTEETIEEAAMVVAYPSLVDFGTISVTGTPVHRTLTLENPTNRTVTVYGHDQPLGLYGDEAEVYAIQSDPILEMPPGALEALRVSFLPGTDGRWEASLTIQPSEQVVALTGRGSAPVLGVDPPEDVAVPIGCEASVPVDIFNQGSAPLEVAELILDDPWDVWSLAADPLPAVIEPGERLRVRYTFAPRWEADSHGPRPATLTIHTNDPATPSTDLTLEGLAIQVDGVEETFTYSPGAAIDLLLVADTDGVMGLRIPQVSEAVPALIDAMEEVDAALHSTVITGASACPVTTPNYAELNTDPSTRVALLQSGLQGAPGPGSDRLGEHTVAALAQVAPGQCLEGFLRDEARLHVLLIAGDEDLSSLRSSTQLAMMEAMAPNASRVIVSTILPTDTVGCDGTTYTPSYAEMASASGGAVLDLCASDLGSRMVQVAVASVADLQVALEHPLGRDPLPESIVVDIDGEPFPHFEYRASDRTLVFDGDNPPASGATVRVQYRAAEEC